MKNVELRARIDWFDLLDFKFYIYIEWKSCVF